MSRLENLSETKKKWLLIGIVLFLILLLVLTAEAAIRVRHFLKYGGMWAVEETYKIDEKSGLRIPIPNLEVGNISINSMGFRSPEISIQKPKNTLRIAFLGASTTYCAEVSSNDMTWPQLVVENLSTHWPDVNIDYINGGVPGYGVDDSIQNLGTRIAPYEPDIIVIYHATNDLSYNSFQLALRKGIVQERTENQSSWLSKYSLFWNLIEKNVRIMFFQSEARTSTGKLTFDAEELAGPFEKSLLSLVEKSKKNSKLVAIASFSYRMRRDQSKDEQINAAVTSLYYMPYMSIDGLLDGFEAYNNAIKKVSDQTNSLYIGGEMSIKGDEVHFTDSVHFTDVGSQVMAKRISEALKNFTDLPTTNDKSIQ